jgi:hypothetical protein
MMYGRIERVAKKVHLNPSLAPELLGLGGHETAGKQKTVDVLAPDIHPFVRIRFQHRHCTDGHTVVAAAVAKRFMEALALAIVTQSPMVEQLVIRADMLVIITRQNHRHPGCAGGVKDRRSETAVDGETVDQVGAEIGDQTGHAGAGVAAVNGAGHAGELG